MQIHVKYFDSQMPKLEKIIPGDWIDLRATGIKINGREIDWQKNCPVFYDEGDFLKIYLGVAMKLPAGHEAHIAPRSSTFKNFGLLQTNSVGVGDENFCGNDDQYFVPMLAMRKGHIVKYERIVQFRIIAKMPQIELIEVKQLLDKNRGGHGTTGTK